MDKQTVTKREANAILAHAFPGCEAYARFDASANSYVAVVWSPYSGVWSPLGGPGFGCDASAYVACGYFSALDVLADTLADRALKCAADGDGEAAGWYALGAASIAASLRGEEAGRLAFERASAQ